MQIPPHLAQWFDHITSFLFALVFRLRTGQGEAKKPAVMVFDGVCQSPQLSPVLTAGRGFS